MEREAVRRISFVWVVIVAAIVVGVVAACAIDVERGPTVRDPTYQEVLQFIDSDQTDKNRYNEYYTCVNFVFDFRNNAFNKGYRSGLVIIDFQETRHAMVCFNTTDNGLIFVEPQDDEIVSLTPGQPYSGRIVLRFSIVW